MKPHIMTLEVGNSYLEGKTMMQVHNFLNRDFVCTRILHDGHVSIPNRDTLFHIGDKLYIVCAEDDAEAIIAFIGPVKDIDGRVINIRLLTIGSSCFFQSMSLTGPIKAVMASASSSAQTM